LGFNAYKNLDVKGKNKGLSDEAILDASLVISYFNFVNRMALSLGVTLEEDGASININD